MSMTRTDQLFAGQPAGPAGWHHVTPAWVAEHIDDVRLVDVREPREFHCDLGHVTTAELVPVAEVPAAARAWDKQAPVVLLCRSCGRSDRTAGVLVQLGFTKVASMSGGMLRWLRERDQLPDDLFVGPASQRCA